MIDDMMVLELISAAYHLYFGLSAVAWTDVIKVSLHIIGGLVTTLLALNYLTPDGGVLNGLSHLYTSAEDKFHMILDSSNAEFMNLHGMSVMIGWIWVANLYNWGSNQSIIQRALAYESLE